MILQGPLSITGSVAKQAENIAYTVVGSDSILAVSGKDSCVHLYGVDDEMQPMWNTANPPRLTVDDDGHILSVGMLAQVAQQDHSSTSTSLISIKNQLGGSATDEDASTPWTGQPAPLVGLADVELSLQASVLSSAPISLFVDPVVPERLYCHHAAGMDAIILQWLPFSDDSPNKRFTGKLLIN
jgi:nuclear pore complex protein Nup88